jgi:hypothetical protein
MRVILPDKDCARFLRNTPHLGASSMKKWFGDKLYEWLPVYR